MKKISIKLIALLLSVVISGCAGNNATPDSPANQPASDPAGGLPASVMVMGAAMYRGTITDIQEEDDTLRVMIEQAQGTNFGHPTLTVAIGEDIVFSGFYAPAQLQVGDYLEVFYGQAPEGEATAISARLLPAAELVIFNGVLEEITVEEGESRVGYMRLSAMRDDGAHVFHFSPAFTQFYLDFDSLQPGDKLNIFHSGVSTRSIPPQSSALEVRYYAE
jgi:hypothetical protein